MYFTERLDNIFRMIFMSYDKKTAKEGLKQLESIVNNDISNSREVGDAYALLARIYAGPQFTPQELGFPEDNMRTYQCLHDSIRCKSPIGTLQALRIGGAITPTVENDMTLSFDDAFKDVLNYAEEGDAYCQYIIGNVYFWSDYKVIATAQARIEPTKPSWTKRISHIPSAHSLRDLIHTLRGTVSRDTLQELATTEAIYWFTKALVQGLALFQGNLRNIYIDRQDYDNAREVARRAAELGNPTMMLYAGLDAHEHKDYHTAFQWFQQGADHGQPECIAELADYYFHFYDDPKFQREIPFEPVKAVALYERAASHDFQDAGYAALQAAFGYIFHIGHLPLDWGRIADLTHMAANKDRYLFALPYIGYMRLHGLGVTRNIRYAVQSLKRVLEEEDRAEREENRVLFYNITRALTRVALGYAFEKGYVTGTPDLDMAVAYYELSHQYIERHKEELEPVLQDYPIDDEGLHRLQAFEEVDGHWQFKEGITESTSTARLAPPSCPQNCIRLAVDNNDAVWDTTEYDWTAISDAIAGHKSIYLSWYNHFLSVNSVMRNIFLLTVKALPRQMYQLTLEGYEYTEGQEMAYEAVLPADEVSTMLRTIYDDKKLPALDAPWHIRQPTKVPQWHYVLDVDQNQFLLEEYNDSPAMIKCSLEGLKSGKYKQINVRTHDFLGPSYFIFPGNKDHTFRVQLLLKETPRHTVDEEGHPIDVPGNTYLLESYQDSDISLNYWIQRTIKSLETPDVSSWKQLTVPRELEA